MNKINKTIVRKVKFKDIEAGTVFEPDMFHTDSLFIKTNKWAYNDSLDDKVICVNLEDGTIESFDGDMVVKVYTVTIDAITYGS